MGSEGGSDHAGREHDSGDPEGPYAFGKAPTITDAFIVPQIYGARRFGLDLTNCQKLTRIADACADHPAFILAHPDNQPDAP